jgi:6-phosphogluconolactonase
MIEVRVLPNRNELSRAAAREVLGQARQAVTEKGLFTVVLSGGSTPRTLYFLLGNDPAFCKEISWRKIHFFWGDERPLPPSHPDSNYGLAWQTMLSKVPVPQKNIHPIRTELTDPGQVVRDYEETLRKFFHLEAGEFPQFDLVLLGLGADGHTASLFPGSEALREQNHLAAANWVEALQGHRITLTLPVFNQAAFILFLVSGQEKAEILRRVFKEDEAKDRLPAQLVRPSRGRVLWLVDREAARLLK